MSNCLMLKKADCRNCYKCIRYCPVKSISFFGNQAHIIARECILCGQCLVVCPQNAKEIEQEKDKAKALIASGAPVIASLAPSFIANYDRIGISAMRRALKSLGFADVEETSIGAAIVKREYEEILRDGKRDVLISSCCHSINLLIQKYFPREMSCLAQVVSPMQAHSLDIKRRIPDAKTVFIGPCVAKKDEAERYPGVVDAVLTFEELTEWMQEEGVELKPEVEREVSFRTRFFPTAGGIIKSMTQDAKGYTYVACDGVDSCMTTLKEIEDGKIHNCFIEMSACVGSCIGGPAMDGAKRSLVKDYVTVSNYAGPREYPVQPLLQKDSEKKFESIAFHVQPPTEEDIQAILKKMGKANNGEYLDCGSCGYNTCREKAIAIYHGKADISMCLPYLRDRAENFSDTIIKNAPNGVIVVDENLHIQQINRSAKAMMNIDETFDVIGEYIAVILDPGVFESVLRTGKGVRDHKVFLPQYKRYVELTVACDHENNLLIGIMRDVTEEENARAAKDRFSRQTVEVADRVVDRQMRIVQEIASLLGETAAETKIALTKLKESIRDE